ncbi:tripartite tricarboxylate transporter substrate binding protein [Variovorax sp. OV329]|uniref:Bug family tripartite tricarboxylate transporter substrate binding protein n=1 Tax=Variovorax sp. OV329 TaxID=1882825 RepID=UPI0008E5AD9C|nr:tripartite tricarboxylate transporter substrate-binding protein [Variovorax sp. OV329]SFM21269.1 Tripartite-type tricarboxylate transporter, receptor component TctC [Variovorax sp. OV329]
MHSLASAFVRPVAAAALAALALAAGPALAQPSASATKPIRVVVPFGPGGVADLTVRTVAHKMSQSMGQSIIVDNKPGAGGVVAADAVAKAPPDGLTVFLMSNGTAVTAGLFEKLPFDTVKDLAPVSTLGYFDMAVVTAAESRFKTMKEFLDYAKANPGKVNIGSINVGSTQHLAAELLKRSLGIDAQVVPFNGSPAMITALRGGQIDAGVEILAPILGQIAGKAIRPIATMGAKRSFALPDTPTVAESGAPGFNVASWNAFAVPAKTPAAVIERLNKEANAALASPEVKEQLRKLGVEAQGSTPEQQAALLKGEIQRWSEVIRQAGIPKQ